MNLPAIKKERVEKLGDLGIRLYIVDRSPLRSGSFFGWPEMSNSGIVADTGCLD